MKRQSTELKGNKPKDELLPERIKSIRNLCDTSLMLIEKGRLDLLPTQLENLFIAAQTLIDVYCVKR